MLPIVAVCPGSRDDRDEFVDGPVEVVVLDDVVEQARLEQLALGQVEPLADLPGALGRALAQPALELGARCGDEDGDDAGQLLGDLERALGLELEDGDPPLAADPLDLRRAACRSAGPRRR